MMMMMMIDDSLTVAAVSRTWEQLCLSVRVLRDSRLTSWLAHVTA
jgi:hypothetical protein